jgi:hypothetical protein
MKRGRPPARRPTPNHNQPTAQGYRPRRSERLRLTPELREWLRREIDRRRREVLRGPIPAELAALRRLFAEEVDA